MANENFSFIHWRLNLWLQSPKRKKLLLTASLKAYRIGTNCMMAGNCSKGQRLPTEAVPPGSRTITLFQWRGHKCGKGKYPWQQVVLKPKFLTQLQRQFLLQSFTVLHQITHLSNCKIGTQFAWVFQQWPSQRL